MKKSQILKVSEESYKTCGELIREGRLVAFPTETVYGLGANALDKEACLNIYKTKGRPLTDPIIVHISKKEDIETLVYFSEKQKKIFDLLSKEFWPGPLTMIFKAKSIIPMELTAGTGYVGIRIPNNKTALKFIEESQRPIAAPSANLFNHVSPTTAKHVFNDFFDQDVTILDDGKTTLGIESTVVKIMDDHLHFYRLGSLPKITIENFLQSKGFDHLEFIYKKNKKQESDNCISPGQFVKHYSPKIPSFILTLNHQNKKTKSFDINNLKSTVFIDLNKRREDMKEKVLSYFDLSEKGSLEEAMQNLYYFLREAEETENAKFILINDIKDFKEYLIKVEIFHFESIYDKIYRACSGLYITIDDNF